MTLQLPNRRNCQMSVTAFLLLLMTGAVIWLTNADAEQTALHKPVESLKCQFYESSNKSCNGNVTQCTTIKECKADPKQPGQNVACMTVWEKDSIHMKNCWTWESAEPCAPSDRCVSQPRAGQVVNFCCCTNDLCNQNIEIQPLTTESTGEKFVLPNNKSSSVLPIVLYTLVPLFLVTCVIVIIYFCVRRYQYGTLRAKQLHLQQSHLLNIKTCNNSGMRSSSAIKPYQPYAAQSAEYGDSMKNMSGDGNAHVPMFVMTKASSALGLTALRAVQKVEKVANGRFGEVWKGALTHSNGTVSAVAIKVFPHNDADSWVQEQEIFSLDAMKSHPNILHFIGAEVRGTGPGAEYWLITEYHHFGSLHQYLRNNTTSLWQTVQICVQTLRGLAYLHEECVTREGTVTKPTIVHRDFKSGNVLLKADLTPCIADFGLAIQCIHGKTISDAQGQQVGTRRYMAPEVLERATEFSAFAFRQIDVYACALVLWEVMSRTRMNERDMPSEYRLPYENEVGLKPTVAHIENVVCKQGKRPIIKQAWRENPICATLCTTMEEMWDDEAEARITAGCAYERCLPLTKQGVNFVNATTEIDTTTDSLHQQCYQQQNEQHTQQRQNNVNISVTTSVPPNVSIPHNKRRNSNNDNEDQHPADPVSSPRAQQQQYKSAANERVPLMNDDDRGGYDEIVDLHQTI